MKLCIFCNKNNFKDFVNFRGTSERYKKNKFTYSKCRNCGSINKISEQEIDHTDYLSGKKKFKLRTRRFIKFLKENDITKDNLILDYGCGSGVFAQSLKDKGYNVEGYEPHNLEFNMIESKKTCFLVYLIQVFEHISDFKEFFERLNKVTRLGSKIITIHPSSTRMPKLDSKDPLQCWTIHAPYHVSIPSDKATIDIFNKNNYKLIKHIPYDIQRSGLIENNNVSALLRSKFGKTREGLINATKRSRMLVYFRNPISFLDSLFIHTKDYCVSTFIFEKQ